MPDRLHRQHSGVISVLLYVLYLKARRRPGVRQIQFPSPPCRKYKSLLPHHLPPPSFRLHPLPVVSVRSEGIFMPVTDWPSNSKVPRNCPSNPVTLSFPTKLILFPNPTNPGNPSRNQPPTEPAGGRFRTMDVGLRRPYLVLLNKGNLKLKESSKAIVENLLHLGLARDGSGKYGDAPPLRSELFSAEQMKQHGRTLAGQHKLSTGRAPDQLLARLAANESVLSRSTHCSPRHSAPNARLPPPANGCWITTI